MTTKGKSTPFRSRAASAADRQAAEEAFVTGGRLGDAAPAPPTEASAKNPGGRPFLEEGVDRKLKAINLPIPLIREAEAVAKSHFAGNFSALTVAALEELLAKYR